MHYRIVLTCVLKMVLPLMTECFNAGNVRQSVPLRTLYSPPHSFAKPATHCYYVLLHLIYSCTIHFRFKTSSFISTWLFQCNIFSLQMKLARTKKYYNT